MWMHLHFINNSQTQYGKIKVAVSSNQGTLWTFDVTTNTKMINSVKLIHTGSEPIFTSTISSPPHSFIKWVNLLNNTHRNICFIECKQIRNISHKGTLIIKMYDKSYKYNCCISIQCNCWRLMRGYGHGYQRMWSLTFWIMVIDLHR